MATSLKQFLKTRRPAVATVDAMMDLCRRGNLLPELQALRAYKISTVVRAVRACLQNPGSLPRVAQHIREYRKCPEAERATRHATLYQLEKAGHVQLCSR